MTLQSRTILNKELSELNAHVLRLASLVDIALDKGMEALTTRNLALAQTVIIGDDEINVMRFEIEEECLQILATQQAATVCH
jgi:phosphate transport system protein